MKPTAAKLIFGIKSISSALSEKIKLAAEEKN